MIRSVPRTLLYIGLSAASLAFLLVPALDVAPMRGLILLLFFVETGDSTLRAWKGGYLRVSLRELATNPPRSEAFQVFAFALGAVAVFRILHM